MSQEGQQEDWKKRILYPFSIRDIKHQEKVAHVILNLSAQPAQPYVSWVLVDERPALSLFWWSADGNQRHFYPISSPRCKELKYIDLEGWDVLFLGHVAELKATKLAAQLANWQTFPTDKLFCLLTVNRPLRGVGNRDLTGLIFPCQVVTRVISGAPLMPKSFCHENWQPAEGEMPPPDPRFQSVLDRHFAF
jgi:hypothetical protein